MIRTALKPRWLALLAAVLLVVAGFVWLGLWQLDVAKDHAAKDALAHAQAQPAAPLHEVLEPHQPFRGAMSNRKVTVTGVFDPSGQFLVPGRLLEGQPGLWVVTPLDEQGSGARVAVVRGFVPEGAAPPTPPSSAVTVSGTVAPGESPSDQRLPAGQRGSVDLAVLVNQWPQDLYNAFVIAQAESPDHAAGSVLRRIPPPQPESQLNLRNLAYALQWWIFAAFALYMWWRMVRDDARASTEPAADHLAAPSDADVQEDPAR